MSKPNNDNPPLRALRHHVSGAVKRGERESVTEIRPRRETFVEYLRRVAQDQDTAGRPSTADDYRAAAQRLDFVEQAITSALVTFEAKRVGAAEREYALARLRDALSEIK